MRASRRLIASNIRRLRTAVGLSQEALAVDAGVDRSYMSRLERGTVSVGVDVLERIADALGCKLGELFREPAEGEDEPRPLRGGRRRGT
jgi:transcriptional regulator with XRE-family HTH domain